MKTLLAILITALLAVMANAGVTINNGVLSGISVNAPDGNIIASLNQATNAANGVYSNNAAGYLTTIPVTATNQFLTTNGNGAGLTGITPGQVGAQGASSVLTNLANGNGGGLTNLAIVTTYNAPVAVTVGASPFLFTNTTATDMRCFISGGTGQVSVGLNATTVAASQSALDYSLIIGPTEYITLIYSMGTPTLYTNKFGR